MKFRIIEIDRDYRAWSDTLYKEFDSLEEAENWCRDESRTGYDYHVHNKEGER